MPEEKKIPLDKLTRLQLVALDTCSRCAHCAEYCPAYDDTEGHPSGLVPGNKARKLSELVEKKKGLRSLLGKSKPPTTEELEKIAGDLYTCTLCGRCQEVCPFGLETEELWRTFRSIICEADKHPQPLKLMDGGIQQKGNPYGANADLRTMWIDYMDFSEAPQKEKAEMVYFVGCTSALKGQAQDITYATSLILNLAQEDWTLLGEKECCCGSPNLMVGNEKAAREFAARNAELIESMGAKRVVTSCPGCYRALKKYPQLLGRPVGFEVFHIVELLNKYLKEGRLTVTEKYKEKIAYHDPCELSRLSGIIEEPREILRSVADNVVELPENRTDGRCCGGGGLLQAVKSDLRLRIASHRLKQAEDAGVEILVSACPSCKMALNDAIQNTNSKIKMLDMTELVVQKLGRSQNQ